jgi:hypothetical protein
MVGPLSSEEIDDVVSSVRRLVSNEQRPRSLSRDLNSERLVLTPALRVLAETGPLSPLLLATPVVEPEDEAAANRAEIGTAPPTSVWAEGDPVLVEADWEDDIWTDAAPSLAEAALGADVAEVLPGTAGKTPDAPVVLESPEPVETDWSAADPIPFVPLRRRAEVLAARLADEGQVQAASPGPAEPAAVPEAEPVPSAEFEPVAEDVLQGVADDGPAEGPGDVILADPEPDDLAFANAMASQADPITGPDSLDEPPLLDVEAGSGLVDADGALIDVLDETALQEIVRHIIRDELQGQLGERITRNVRKLVRAEINRALIARDLD